MNDVTGFDGFFDEVVDRRGTHSSKWDMMEERYGVSPEDGIAMWVADMDFRSPPCVTRAVARMAEHGVYGYWGDDRAYRQSICWWMLNRHGWKVEPDWIFTTHGLVNAVCLAVESWTEPGDSVVLFTPVYHAFARVIRAAGRRVTELPLVVRDGRYEMDFDSYGDLLTGRERMAILCSPHNPGGRVWSGGELTALAGFCVSHDLILVSDEIHHDLVYPGHTHLPMAVSVPEILDRLVMLTAASKTFNIAGTHTGNAIVPDPTLRAAFGRTMAALGISPNNFGVNMVTAAYSPEGAAWVDALVDYLDGNRKVFDAAMNSIPGVRAMPLEATYLSWVDFSGTGLSQAEALARVEGQARIAVNHGPTFGLGGDDFLRFNIGLPRSVLTEAVSRLTAAFADLQ